MFDGPLGHRSLDGAPGLRDDVGRQQSGEELAREGLRRVLELAREHPDVQDAPERFAEVRRRRDQAGLRLQVARTSIPSAARLSTWRPRARFASPQPGRERRAPRGRRRRPCSSRADAPSTLSPRRRRGDGAARPPSGPVLELGRLVTVPARSRRAYQKPVRAARRLAPSEATERTGRSPPPRAESRVEAPRRRGEASGRLLGPEVGRVGGQDPEL